MRDIAIAVLVFGLLPFVFKHPVIGAYLWAWLSMMNPHKLAFGFANDLPFAYIVAVTTILAFVFTDKRRAPPLNGILIVYALLLLWMSVTCLYAVADRGVVLDRWIHVMKTHVMLVVTLCLIREPRQLQILVWLVTFSVAFFGIKGGVWTLLTGGGGRVWGPPGGVIQGNNELAVALVMLMPFLYYLHHTVSRRWLRYALVACMAAVTFSVLGSQSRGALIALAAMVLVLGLKGKHPVRTTVVLVAFTAVAINFMPDTWTERMDTIANYEQDTSALSRIWTWKTYWAAAVDRPLVGVGFSADNAAVFARYAPIAPEYDVFDGRVFVAHSIYFQMLGEHGFVGLGLYLLLGWLTWRTAGRIARQTRDDAEFGKWMPLLMYMCQVSLVGLGAGGAFLSLAYFDVPYYIVGYVVLCDAMVRERARRRASAAAPSPGAPGMTRSDPMPSP